MGKTKTKKVKKAAVRDEFSARADAMIEILLVLKPLSVDSRIRVMRIVQAYFG